MSTEKIHAVDGTLAFEVGPNGDRPGVRVTTHLPLTGSTLSIPLDEDATQAMAMAMLAVAPDAARPATATAPSTPAAGVGSSAPVPGAQIGAQGLGDAIRGLGTHASVPDEYADALADRADALERERDEWKQAGQANTEHHKGALRERDAFQHDLTNLRDGLMERVGRYTPSDADLLAYVDALRAQIERVRALAEELTEFGYAGKNCARRIREALDGIQ